MLQPSKQEIYKAQKAKLGPATPKQNPVKKVVEGVKKIGQKVGKGIDLRIEKYGMR